MDLQRRAMFRIHVAELGWDSPGGRSHVHRVVLTRFEVGEDRRRAANLDSEFPRILRPCLAAVSLEQRRTLDASHGRATYSPGEFERVTGIGLYLSVCT